MDLRFPSNEEEWMPCLTETPQVSALHEIPFSMLGKAFGHIADWTGVGSDAQQRGRRQLVRDDQEDGWSFSLADAKSVQTRKTGKIARGPAPVVIRAGAGLRPAAGGRSGGAGGAGGSGGFKRMQSRFSERAHRHREPSISAGADWKLLEEIEFSRLFKLQLDPDFYVLEKEEGTARAYDRSVERIATRNERVVPTSTAAANVPAFVAAMQDPFFEQLALADCDLLVCTTDVVATLLMATTRTVNSWDLFMEMRGNKLFIDKRSGSNIGKREDLGFLDLVSINETSAEPPSDDPEPKDAINSAASLALEATKAGLAVSLLVTKGNSKDKYCRYMVWDLGKGVKMAVRCAVDAVESKPGASKQSHYVLVKTLLEYDPRPNMNWRQRLDVQRGAVLASEMKNNAALLARWVFQAVLADLDSVKIAFASRVSPKDSSRHSVLAIQDCDPEDLAAQMNLNLPNSFGIIRAIVDLCRDSGLSRFALVRDPNKPILRFYSCPAQQ